MQSAAMEETVIWEQHTVTLHRVGIGAGLFFYSIMFWKIHLPLSQFVFPVFDLEICIFFKA